MQEDLKRLKLENRDLRQKYDLICDYLEINDIDIFDAIEIAKNYYCPACGEPYNNGWQHGVQIGGGVGSLDPPDYICVPADDYEDVYDEF